MPSSREREDSEGYQVAQFPGTRGQRGIKLPSSREREDSEGSSCLVPRNERIARDQVAQFPGMRG